MSNRQAPKARYHPDPERRERIERIRKLTHPLTVNHDPTSEIARLAATLIAEEGINDYGFAKRKALERLGLPPRTPLPDNAAVDVALKEHLAIFGGEEHTAMIRAMREAALEVMRSLAEFSPRLTGSVLAGTANTESEIVIQLYPDDAKTVEIHLINQGIEYEAEDLKVGTHALPRLHFEHDGFAVALVIHPYNDLKHAQKTRDGREIERANASDIESLLAHP